VPLKSSQYPQYALLSDFCLPRSTPFLSTIPAVIQIPEPYLDIEEETPQAATEPRTPTLANGRPAKSAAVPPRTPLAESGTPKKASEGKGMTAEVSNTELSFRICDFAG
jgi:hypothetical protein